MRRLSFNGAADRLGGPENLQHSALELLCQTLRTHRPCDLNDVVKGNVSGVFDVLLLLSVARRLLESADDKGGGGGDD